MNLFISWNLMFLLLFLVANCYCCDLDGLCLNTIEWDVLFYNCSDLPVISIPCNISEVPSFLFHRRQHISLALNSCFISHLRWQSVFSREESVVDVSKCPLSCDCENVWMSHHSRGVHLLLPPDFRCPAFSECEYGRLSPSYLPVDAVLGSRLVLEVFVEGGIYDEYISNERQYFSWVLGSSVHNYTEEISSNRLRLVIPSVSPEDLGVVRVVCWHCRQPLMATIELRINSPLHVSLESSSSSLHLVVAGHPLQNLSLTMAAADNSTSETRVLPSKDSEKQLKFYGSLIVRPEIGNSHFHHRVFTVFSVSCNIDCDLDHISGNYSFTVCNRPFQKDEALMLLTNSSVDNSSTVNSSSVAVIGRASRGECVTVYHFINYVNGTSQVIEEAATPPDRSSVVLPLLMIATVVGALVFYLTTKSKVAPLIRDKWLIWRKRRYSAAPSSGSRRASRATEETMLRLEERGSLCSSDYSGQIVPFIKGETLQIHEIIGKGAFGDVYCGSWEKTGERSIAVKAIPQADSEIEKEAQVLCRLDHPNIVRLYGVTRHADRLLLVFEYMNQGDLRSYLRQRAPKVTDYSQFPPALVVDELRFIIREVVKGVRYLGAQQIVHRDVAARNCLVAGETDERSKSAAHRPPISVKISDFGMSRRLTYQSDYYRMQNHSLLPVRWLPPEAINEHKFSHSSDIWALGVTMWEVFSYGKVPFDSLSNHEVVSYAMAGMRPPCPGGCPQEMYNLMERCWELEPESRISAEEILLHAALEETTVVT